MKRTKELEKHYPQEEYNNCVLKIKKGGWFKVTLEFAVRLFPPLSEFAVRLFLSEFAVRLFPSLA
jgi:hypothetical protein